MSYLYALLAAVLIAVMVVTNGQLSDLYNSYMASILIHATGLIAISVGVIMKKEQLKKDHIPWFIYSGGAIGVATTLFTNLSYGKITVTAIIALGLFAQMVTSFFIDQFGWFGMPIKKVNLPKVVGLIFTLIGIIYLLNGSQFHLVAVILSLATGVTIVISRYVNAIMAKHTSVLASTWYNFFIGLIVSVIVWAFALSFHQIKRPEFVVSKNIWMYTGGLLGGCVVALSCVCAKKLSAIILTLIMFVGQLFTGVLLDYILEHTFSLQIVIGGILTALGLIVSLLPYEKKSKGS